MIAAHLQATTTVPNGEVRRSSIMTPEERRAFGAARSDGRMTPDFRAAMHELRRANRRRNARSRSLTGSRRHGRAVRRSPSRARRAVRRALGRAAPSEDGSPAPPVNPPTSADDAVAEVTGTLAPILMRVLYVGVSAPAARIQVAR